MQCLLTAKDLTPYRAILVRHLETHGFVILCFHDSRDTMKVYNKLLISSVRYNRALGPVSLQCTAIRRDVVRAVSRNLVACSNARLTVLLMTSSRKSGKTRSLASM